MNNISVENFKALGSFIRIEKTIQTSDIPPPGFLYPGIVHLRLLHPPNKRFGFGLMVPWSSWLIRLPIKERETPLKVLPLTGKDLVADEPSIAELEY